MPETRKREENAEATEADTKEEATEKRRSKRARSEVDYEEPSDRVEPQESPEREASEAKDGSVKSEDGDAEDAGGGISVDEYRRRLVSKDKDLYKDPPVLPVFDAEELPRCDEPVTRDEETRAFQFPDHPEFRPNVSPEEVLRAGSFGGTYFRSIDSAVLNRRIDGSQALNESVPAEWIEGLDKARMLTSQDYDVDVNKYGVKCGGSLGMWESSGWISNIDPYGWFQWYCRFFQGRRTDDDERQISRALGCMGPKGRFRNQLLNKIIRANTTFDDESISPVIRQNLQHWGYHVTEGDFNVYKRGKEVD